MTNNNSRRFRMCMGGGGGPSAAAKEQARENERLAEERANERRSALLNPEDKFDQLEDNDKTLRRKGRKGLTIPLDKQSSSGSGLSIN